MTAERAGDGQRMSRAIERRCYVDVAGSRATRACPGVAPLVLLRLQTRRRAVHDVQVTFEGQVRIPVDGEDPVLGVERTIGVGPRRVGVEGQAMRGAITGADDAAVDHDLPAARTLLGYGECGVDRKRCCGD